MRHVTVPTSLGDQFVELDMGSRSKKFKDTIPYSEKLLKQQKGYPKPLHKIFEWLFDFILNRRRRRK